MNKLTITNCTVLFLTMTTSVLAADRTTTFSFGFANALFTHNLTPQQVSVTGLFGTQESACTPTATIQIGTMKAGSSVFSSYTFTYPDTCATENPGFTITVGGVVDENNTFYETQSQLDTGSLPNLTTYYYDTPQQPYYPVFTFDTVSTNSNNQKVYTWHAGQGAARN